MIAWIWGIMGIQPCSVLYSCLKVLGLRLMATSDVKLNSVSNLGLFDLKPELAGKLLYHTLANLTQSWNGFDIRTMPRMPMDSL